MSKTILLGKFLDTEDKVMAEVDELTRRLQKARKADPDHDPKMMLWDQAMESWDRNSAGSPHSEDLKAVEYAFGLHMNEDLASPGKRYEEIKEIAKQRIESMRANGQYNEVAGQKVIKLMAAIDKLGYGTTMVEKLEADKQYTILLKEAQTAMGKRPCGSRSCLGLVGNDERANKKYCSKRCRENEKSARARDKNPEAYEKYRFNYLKSIFKKD
jgi:hypothetical protein